MNRLYQLYTSIEPLDFWFQYSAIKSVKDLKMLPLPAIPDITSDRFLKMDTLLRHTLYYS